MATPYRPTCGFRFSNMDGIVCVVVAAFSVVAYREIGPFALLMPFVFGHFLLFCNVFRIGTDFELIWACWFIAVVSAELFLGNFDWWLTLVLQTPVTLLLLILAMRSPWYRGVGYRRINRNLDNYLNDPAKYEGYTHRTMRKLFRSRRDNNS